MAINTHTRRVLWGRSGGICALCRRGLVIDASGDDPEALVGQEAHIISAAPNGPRHEPEPEGGYDHLDNLMLLCSVCHDTIDAQSSSHTVQQLREARAKHERWVAERLRADDLLKLSITPLPARVELDLIASGRQLVALLNGVQDFVLDHDQPRSEPHAHLMGEFVAAVDEADLELHAVGIRAVVGLAQRFQVMLLEELLPAGVVVMGARVERTISGGTQPPAPWNTCILRLRYAPRSEPSRHEAGSSRASVEQLQELLREGRELQGKARISTDGSSAAIEVWERDLRRTLTAAGRHDFLARVEGAEGIQWRSMISGPWATRHRLARQLESLGDLIGELEMSS